MVSVLCGECEKLLKEGKKFSSFLKRDYYTAAISFIRAAECFQEKKIFNKAYHAAIQAIKCLEKTKDFDISDDIERTFEIAYNSAKNLEEEKFHNIRSRFFAFLLNYAHDLQLSKNFIEAAKKYEKAAEMTNESEKKKILGKAVECLKKAAETKIKTGKKEIAIKLLKHGKKLLREIGDQTTITEIDQKLQELGTIPVEAEISPPVDLKKEIFEEIAKTREEIGNKVEKAIEELKKTTKIKEIAKKPLKIEGEPTLLEKIRKKGKFFDKLSYVILQILRDECPKRSGIITLSDIVLLVNESRKENPLSSDIIFAALEILERDGLIPKIETLSSGVKIIPFIELTSDHKEILNIASEKGWTTIEEIVIKTGWSKEKALLTLKNMEKTGIAISQTTADKGTKWYFPALYKSGTRKADRDNNLHVI